MVASVDITFSHSSNFALASLLCGSCFTASLNRSENHYGQSNLSDVNKEKSDLKSAFANFNLLSARCAVPLR